MSLTADGRTSPRWRSHNPHYFQKGKDRCLGCNVKTIDNHIPHRAPHQTITAEPIGSQYLVPPQIAGIPGMSAGSNGVTPVEWNLGPGKGVTNRAKTHCLKGHPYDEVNVRVTENGRRRCRACDHLAYLARKEAAA